MEMLEAHSSLRVASRSVSGTCAQPRGHGVPSGVEGRARRWAPERERATLGPAERCCEPNASQDPQPTWRRVRGLFRVAVLTVTLSTPSAVIAGQLVDHSLWDGLLHRYVNTGLVNYSGVAKEQAVLEQYLASLRMIDPATLASNQARLAFWINAYNTCVIKGVLDHYPIKSVQDVKGFFDKIRYDVAGQSLTLNEIEAKGRALGDWRIHFAVVCASSSCPTLRGEAYVPERLEAQLNDQVRHFLADGSRGLRVDAASKTLWVSKIFKWYAKDIVPRGPLNVETLIPVIHPYLDPVLVQSIQQQTLQLKFLDYDWSLNAQSR